MSRIGKKPVPVPAGVTANVAGQVVKIKGSKGELCFTVPDDVSVAMEDGAIPLGADPQEYRPSDAELVAAEAGDRLAAALSGADDATKAAIATTLGGDASYKRFDYRVVDVMGSGRYFYASSPKGASLPL